MVELDLRTPNGLRRSHLLHRLDALGVPWGTLEEGRGTSGHVPRDVAAGVGARAVGAPRRARRLRHDGRGGGDGTGSSSGRRRGRGLAELTAALEGACSPTCRDASGRSSSGCSARWPRSDPDVGQLMDALGPLARALRYGDVRGTDVGALRTVFDGWSCGSSPGCRARLRVARRRRGARRWSSG